MLGTYTFLEAEKPVQRTILEEESQAPTADDLLPVNELQIRGSNGFHLPCLPILEANCLIRKFQFSRCLETNMFR